MNKMFGFEDYAIIWADSDFFTTNSSYYKYRLITNPPSGCYGNLWFRMCDSDSKPQLFLLRNSLQTNLKFLELEMPISTIVPEKGKRLYFEKACTIPRLKCGKFWERSLKPEKADAVVIPEVLPTSIAVLNNCIVFANHDRKTLVIIRFFVYDMILPERDQSATEWLAKLQNNIGSKTLSGDDVTAMDILKESSCIFVGPIFTYDDKKKYIFDVLDGKYPNVISENQLLAEMSDEESAFTLETVDSLIDLMKSSDPESVFQGLRILASMDYINYPSIAKHILQASEYRWRNLKTLTTSIKFMLSTLEPIWGVFSNVKEKERDLAKILLKRKIEKDLAQTISSLTSGTNLKINVTTNVTIEN